MIEKLPLLMFERPRSVVVLLVVVVVVPPEVVVDVPPPVNARVVPWGGRIPN